MYDERSLSFELFFPAECRFDGAGVPKQLQDLMERRRTTGRRRVLVAQRTDIESHANLYDYEGVVSIGATYSEARLRTLGFGYFQRYVALPSLSNLRWLLPLTSKAVAAGALDVYTPYRRKAQLQRQMLQMAMRLGRMPPRAKVITIIRRQEPELLRQVACQFPDEEISLAVSSGTVGSARKPTIGAIDKKGRTLAYAKVATSKVGESLLRNEASALSHIAQDDALGKLAPRLLLAGVLDGRFVEVQKALAGAPAPELFGQPQRDFLDALSTGPARPVPESSFVRTLLKRVAAKGDGTQAGEVLWRAVKELGRVELPDTLLHGDFAPWNLRLQDGRIVAFDWEYASPDALPGLDELHHIWQVGFLLHGWTDAQARASLGAWAASKPFDLDQPQALALTDIYLAHGLMQRLETGADERDELARHYRAALTQRAATQVAPA